MRRLFKGIWIPAEIWLDDRLNIAEKALIAEIESLSTDNGACVETNKYFAEFARADERTIQRYLSHLIAIDLIEVTNGAKRRIRVKRDRPTEEPPKQEPTSRSFIPPTVDEVRAYCEERKNNIDPQGFVDFYTATGWWRGKNKIKDWKACVRTWERLPERQSTGYTKEAEYLKHDYSKEQIDSVVRRTEDMDDDWGD